MAQLPNVVIIGAQRCGTTSLYAAIGTHRDIGLSNAGELDEIHFFVNRKRYKRGLEWYKRQFENRHKVVIEKSPMSLQHWLAPRRMVRVMRRVKLIVMLRNPIDRAYSNYRKAVAKGFVDGSFEEALAIEETIPELEPQDWVNYWGGDMHLFGFLDMGHYARHLKRWFEFFKPEQFLILKSEDFYSEPQTVIQKTLDFIGVDVIELESKHLQNLSYSDMSKETRNRLRAHFEPLNRELYELIGRDMGWK